MVSSRYKCDLCSYWKLLIFSFIIFWYILSWHSLVWHPGDMTSTRSQNLPFKNLYLNICLTPLGLPGHSSFLLSSIIHRRIKFKTNNTTLQVLMLPGKVLIYLNLIQLLFTMKSCIVLSYIYKLIAVETYIYTCTRFNINIQIKLF